MLPSMRSRSPLVTPALALCLALTAVACSDTEEPSTDGRLTVAASFFPIEEVVRAVAGDLAEVVGLVPAGEEAHEYEPTPRQVAALEDADVVFYLGRGFQPSVERAIAGLPERVARVDLLEGLSLLTVDDALEGTEGEVGGEELEGDLDPHVWLDPANMAAMADRVRDVLRTLVPASDAASLDASAAAYRAGIEALDGRLADGLAECESRLLVTGHRAFAYLAAAYDLRQVPIAGVSPSEEPSATTLETVADLARREGVRVIFAEDTLPDDLARTIADEVGVGTAVLHTAESLSPEERSAGATYSSLMDGNLATLRDGLGCT